MLGSFVIQIDHCCECEHASIICLNVGPVMNRQPVQLGYALDPHGPKQVKVGIEIQWLDVSFNMGQLSDARGHHKESFKISKKL